MRLRQKHQGILMGPMKPLLVGALIAGMPLGCAPPQPSAPGVEPASTPTSSDAPTPDASPEVPTAELRVSVRDGVVSVEGEETETLTPGQVRRVDGVFRVMRRLADARRGAPFRVAVSGVVDAAQFKSVIQTAAYAGWPVATLETARGDVSLHSLAPNAPRRELPQSVILLVVRSDAVEVWLTQRDGKAPTAERLDEGRSLAETLKEECPKAACNPVALLATNDAPYRAIESALAALQNASDSSRLQVDLSASSPGAPGTPPRPPAASSGRLPPEVIQGVVRAAHPRLQACYLSGLKRDPELNGKVVMRFQIEREGTVGDVAPSPETTLSDASVITCMIGVYQKLAFPAPEGGVVTVVYPIQFSPE